MLFAELHTGFIDGDLDQPGAELALAAKLFDVHKCLQHRLLRGVFGIRVVVQHRPCRKEYRSLVRADQAVEGFLIAFSHSADQLLLHHINLRLRLRCHAYLHCGLRGTRRPSRNNIRQSGRYNFSRGWEARQVCLPVCFADDFSLVPQKEPVQDLSKY